ncbi:MAG: ribosome maturation factor RimP [Bulleidia sp.]
MTNIQRLAEMFAPVLEEMDIRLYDLQYRTQGKEHILEVAIMKADGSMDLDTCALVSEKLSDVLDAEDPISEEYTLEVCSPGAEREIRDLNELDHMSGSYVYVRLKHPFKSMLEFTGEIVDVQDGVITLDYRDKAAHRKAEFTKDNIDYIRMAVRI